MNQQALSAFIWSVADLLRGDYKQSEYGKVILPFTVLRRLDCVLEPTKEKVLAEIATRKKERVNPDAFLRRKSKVGFYNASPLNLPKLMGDQDHIRQNLEKYIEGFSPEVRDIFDKFEFETQVERLARSKLLYQVTEKFANIDLHPKAVDNHQMGLIFEELIRKFAELSNETAGEHFTPREVIRLMVNLIFVEDDDVLSKEGVVRSLYDPTVGTGGMLSVAGEYLAEHNPKARLTVSGQELNPESYAICKADMLIKGHDIAKIIFGNTLSEDGHPAEKFDYMLANPPFGVEWKKVEDIVKNEAESKGFAGRFGAGTPRINDGSFLFLQHMISKMKPVSEGGSRVAIVFNGSPLFTGAAGSGESEIRRWIIENDMLEAVVALPDQLFYNTGISTYFWIVTNRKSEQRRGKVQLVDARELFVKMRKSLGEKRKEISAAQIDEITRLYGDFTENDKVKVFPNEAFGYLRVTVERPLRLRWEIQDGTISAVMAAKPIERLDEPTRTALRAALQQHHGLTAATQAQMTKTLSPALRGARVPSAAEKAIWAALAVRDDDAPVITDKKGNPDPDPDLRDNENVPLPPIPITWAADPTERLATTEYRTTVEDYLTAEVHPYVPDAWADHDRTKIGYEIPLTRHFYKYTPPRPLADIDAEIKALETEIQRLLAEVTE